VRLRRVFVTCVKVDLRTWMLDGELLRMKDSQLRKLPERAMEESLTMISTCSDVDLMIVAELSENWQLSTSNALDTVKTTVEKPVIWQLVSLVLA